MTGSLSQTRGRPEPELTLRAVKWRDGQFSTSSASIGRFRIGHVSWKLMRESKDWCASSALTGESAEFDKIEHAKAWVESEAYRFVLALAALSPADDGGAR